MNLKLHLSENKPFPWVKKGLLFTPGEDGYSHGSHPCAIHVKDNLYIIAFSRRDSLKRSHVFLSYAEVKKGEVTLLGEPKLALSPENPGFFDCDGTISACLVKKDENYYLYYVGWQNLPEGLWAADSGRAILDPENLTLTRQFNGPVLGRDKTNPLFAATTAFHVRDDLWQTWYLSGLKWEKTSVGWKHYYALFYAHSSDGIVWDCSQGQCLPFANEYEYAYGRPSVIRIGDIYYMWFAHRATRTIDTYRMGFASSADGINWNRNDSISGIDVSPSGWDSEMICYPCVFEHKGLMYMLYNGNGYGKTGFGLAVLEEGE